MKTLVVTTQLGEFELALQIDRAPKTCAYFEAIAQKNALDNSIIFRIISHDNHRPGDTCPIQVVQIGTPQKFSTARESITHENTRQTGLCHRKWTVSAARFDAGELYRSFFVCMRDEPELDFGGRRQPDGEGYAAFGHVIDGFATLEKIFGRAEDDEMLRDPIPVFEISLLEELHSDQQNG